MNIKMTLKCSLLSLFLCVSAFLYANRVEQSFNKQWKFLLQDDADFALPEYDDNAWQVLNVPHDWSFEKGVRKGGDQGQGGGYHDGGVAWYRKSFTMTSESLSKTCYIDFQGVYMNSEVYINGTKVGKRPYGYISFRYNISDYLKVGENTVAVRVDNSLEPSARWYHPCGIYAPVSLIEVNPLHIIPNGVYVSTPLITPENARVSVDISLTAVKLSNDISIKTSLLSPDGDELVSTQKRIRSNRYPVSLSMEIENPRLWSPESPILYTLVSQVIQGDKVLDEVKTTMGFRTIKWDVATGFWLNGENVKLKGVCEHWEGGPVGGAWTKPMLRWKLQLLKDMGINAIRPSHNPAPPMFYDICDEIGLLVMDELFDGWMRKAPNDYGKQAFAEWWKRDMEEWIKRDRNHPSVIIWSMGNETHGDIASSLVQYAKSLDPTRLVTSGASNSEDMDVIGVNGGSETKAFIESCAFDKPFISTEAPHTWQTRGYYRTQTWWRDGELKGTYELPHLTDKEIFHYEWTNPKNWTNKKQHFNSSYDNATVRISARKNWEVMRDLPWHSGHFRWTGFDYYGEAGLAHGGLPFNLFMGGALDVAGFKKDLFYFYQSQWTKETMLHILPSWTHPRMANGTLIPVWVYSNAEEVELFLNGKSLGKDKPGTVWNEMQCEWMVPYTQGQLLAVAYINGEEVKRAVLNTAKQAAKLCNAVHTLSAENGFNEAYIVTSEGQDVKNELNPYTENKVYYHLCGDVRKVSLENGNPVDATSRTNANYRSLFFGKTRAFLEAKNKAVKASVIIASILGDKSLYSSDLVSISLDELALKGKLDKRNLLVLYTKHGGDPAKIGQVYDAPFSVIDGTTVRAVVLLDGEVLFEMNETFGQKEGLFWGDEHSEDMWIGRGITVAAEHAILEGSAKVSVEGRRFKSDGFVVFDNDEGAINWYQENDGMDGEYTLRFRYTHNDKESLRPMTLIVNDEMITTFDFKPTGAWDTDWKFVSAKVKFKAGANNIVLKTTGQSGPHIDEMFVQ